MAPSGTTRQEDKRGMAAPRAGRARGLRDLALAVCAGALLWVADRWTGRHFEAGMSAIAGSLEGWYENRREPVILCWPRKPVSYAAASGIVFDVPTCWKTEVASLLDSEVHRFRDPDARAGTLSVRVEAVSDEESAAALRSELERLGRTRGARIGLPGPPAASGASDASPGPEGASPRPDPADSLASRLVEPAADPAEGSTRAGSAGGAAPSPEKAKADDGLRCVETHLLLGPSEGTPGEGDAGSPRPREVWSWLLVSDRLAVRIVYAVREDWAGYPAVANELKAARALVASVRLRGSHA